MNRKHNPLLSLIAMALLLVILLTACTAHEMDPTAATEDEPAPRFTVERIDSTGSGTCYIITDTETGVQYLYFTKGYGGGLTVLQPGEE